MADDDLIRRGDALEFCEMFPYPKAAIAALPAQGLRVRALEWADYEEIVRDAQSGMHYASRALNGFNAYFVMQDGEQFRWWTSGHQTDHSVAHPTFDAAKAAAQADFAGRILDVTYIAPAEAGGVEVKPYSLRPDLQRIVDNAKTAPQWDTERDCLAPAPVDALVEAAERAERIIANGQPDEIADAGAILRAALSAIRESRT